MGKYFDDTEPQEYDFYEKPEQGEGDDVDNMIEGKPAKKKVKEPGYLEKVGGTLEKSETVKAIADKVTELGDWMKKKMKGEKKDNW